MPYIHSSMAVAGTENHMKVDGNSDHQVTITSDTTGAGVANHVEDMERYNGDVIECEPGQWTHVDRHSNSRHSQKRRMIKPSGNNMSVVDGINTFRPRSYRTNTSRDNASYSGSVGSHTLPRARTAHNFHGSHHPSNGVPEDVVSSTSQLSLTSGPDQTVEPRLIQPVHVSPTSPTSTSVSSSDLQNGFDNGGGGGGEGRDNNVAVDCHSHVRPMRPRGGFRSYCDNEDYSSRGYYSHRPQHQPNHPCNNHTSGPTGNTRPPGRFARSPTSNSVANISNDDQWRRPTNGPNWRRSHTMSFPFRGHGSYYSQRFNAPNTFNHYQPRPRYRTARPSSPLKNSPTEPLKSHIRPTFESSNSCTTTITPCDAALAPTHSNPERPESDRHTTSWAAAVAAPPPQDEQQATAVAASSENHVADSTLIAFMQSQWKLFSRQPESSPLSLNSRAYLST